jgi:hypothetical protein
MVYWLELSLIKDRSVWWISVPTPLGEGNYPGVEVDERGHAL